MLGALLRLYSYAYEFVLSLFLCLVSLVVLTGGKHQLSMPMLPWEGASLTYWLFGLSLVGIIITVLAVIGRIRPLFCLWCLFVVVMMVRGFFLSSFYYSGGADQFYGAVALIIGAVVALLSSLTLLTRERR